MNDTVPPFSAFKNAASILCRKPSAYSRISLIMFAVSLAWIQEQQAHYNSTILNGYPLSSRRA